MDKVPSSSSSLMSVAAATASAGAVKKTVATTAAKAAAALARVANTDIEDTEVVESIPIAASSPPNEEVSMNGRRQTERRQASTAASVTLAELAAESTGGGVTGGRSPTSFKKSLTIRNNSSPNTSVVEPEETLLMKEAESLPAILRKPTGRSLRARQVYPHTVHQHFLSFGDVGSTCEDPYLGNVVWAKMPGFPFWPSRLATEEERQVGGSTRSQPLAPIQSLDDDCGGLPTDLLLLYFYGSGQMGVVKRAHMEPYVAKYKELSARNAVNRQFQLGLEEADADVLRIKFPDGVGKCMRCGGVDDPEETILLCDRCNSEVHMGCLDPPMHEVPEHDWLCPVCVADAPITWNAVMKTWEKTEKLNKKKRKSSGVGKFLSKSLTVSQQEDKEEDDDDDDEGSRKPYNDNHDRSHWTTEEDCKLLQSLYESNGNWLQVSNVMVGRTFHACKNRHASLHRKGMVPNISMFHLDGPNGKKQIDQESFNQVLANLSKGENVVQATTDGGSTNMNNISSSSIATSAPTVVEDTSQSIALAKPKRTASFVNGGADSATSTKKTSPAAASSSDPPTKKQKPATTEPSTSAATTSSKKSSSNGKTSSSSSQAQHDSSDKTNLGTLVSEALRSAKTQAIQAKTRFCFVCSLPNASIACADERCDKTYHAFCLGSMAPPQAVTKSKRWYCPWHHCAVCRALEDEKSKSSKHITPLPKSFSGSSSHSMQEAMKTFCRLVPSPNGAVTTTTTEMTTVGDETVKLRCKSIVQPPRRRDMSYPTMKRADNGYIVMMDEDEDNDDDSEDDENEAQDLDIASQENGASSTTLFRCASCPLALCSDHLDVACPAVSFALDNPQQRLVRVVRSSVQNFFACERCSGINVSTSTSSSMYATTIKYLPRTSISSYLDKMVNMIATKHNQLLAFLMDVPSKQTVELVAGKDAVGPFFETTPPTVPLSLGAIQRKVRLLGYVSTTAFQEDVVKMCDALHVLYKRTQPRLAEAVTSLVYIVEEELRKLSSVKEIARVSQVEVESQVYYFGKGSISDEVVAKQDNFSPLVGLTPWETYIRYEHPLMKRSQQGILLKQWNSLYDEPEPNDKKSGLTALYQALQTTKLVKMFSSNPSPMDALLVPHKDDIMELFEEHSLNLRTCLRSNAELRRQVKKAFEIMGGDRVADTSNAKQVIQEQQDDEEDIEEFVYDCDSGVRKSGASKSLRSQLEESRQALEMEKRARIQLEKRVQELLQQTKGSGKPSM